jgi:transposase
METKQTHIPLSGLEKVLLKNYAKTSPLVLVRSKAQAIIMASKDINPEDIGDILDRKERTIILWLRDWDQKRLSSIFTGHQYNDNAGKLTREQLEEIRQALQSPPSDFGLPKAFWDVPQLKTYVKASFDVRYESDKSYRFILQFSNLSFKYADTFDRKRDEVFIEERMNAIATELTPLLSDDAWEIFAADEVRMQQEAIIRRAWLKKGERTVVKVNRKKESQSYIGFLNQKNHACELFELDWQKSSEVLKACKTFLEKYPNKKICIVWDNASFHKSEEIRKELKTGGILERVHLIAMPPYAPDNNPIEHVWNTAKQAVSNIQHDTFTETKQAFASFVSQRTFSYTF